MANTNVAPLARPAVSTTKPLAKITTIAEAIDHPELRERLQMAAPRHMNPERLLRVFHLALQKTPDLAKADLRELLGALIGFAAIGIEPNTPLGHGWLIPFGKRQQIDGQWQTVGVQIQPIIGYRGFIDLARRSGSLVSIHADVVYHGDDFSYEYGTDEHLRHRYGDRDAEVLTPEFAYACASVEGGHQFEVMPWKDVLRIRDGSQGYTMAKRRGGRTLETTPWVAHQEAMARKTPIRRLFKTLPTSIEQSVAVNIDEVAERRHVRFGALIDASPAEVSADTMDALVDATDYDAPEEAQQAQPEPEQEKAKAPAKAQAAPKAEPQPEPQPEPASEAEAAQGVTLVWPDGSSVPYDSADEASEAMWMAMNDATTLADVDGLAKTAEALRPHLSKEALKGMAAAFKEARARVDTPAEETAQEAEAGTDEAPAAEAEAEAAAGDVVADWSVNVKACTGTDGKVNTMMLMNAVDDKSKECMSADDWHEFIEQNGPALEVLQGKLKSGYDKLMARYKKATA
jgi:recombination protein RecT